jgi:hypothetical protein
MRRKESIYEQLIFKGITGICFLIAVTDFIGLLDNWKLLSVRIPSMMLLLLCAIAIYLLYENSSQEILKEIKDSHDSISNLIKDGNTVQYSSPEETYKYFVERIEKAQTSIDITHFGGRPYNEDEPKYYGRADYYKTLEKIIKGGKIRVRRIQLVRDTDSFNWMKETVEKFVNNSFYLGCYVGEASDIPQLSVMVIDEEEVCLACTEKGFHYDQKMISIKNTIFAGMMKSYIDILWRKSFIVKERIVDKDMLTKIEGKLQPVLTSAKH